MNAVVVANNTTEILGEIELMLTKAFQHHCNAFTTNFNATTIVGQLCDELSQKRIFWLGEGTFVPSQLNCHITVKDHEQEKALKAIFLEPSLLFLLTQYIYTTGFKLFHELKIAIDVKIADNPKNTSVEIEFLWAPDE